ncbi:hypothetical protein DPMN_076923 [Dreissena polymorpha]|uniref:Uncharacterized protein n=1 Tax=Dreissena polymorpha TaxID=45954 RepID=A0A9D4BP45_DREPO|nr:hypothetical protein DPMN_076923 [Dreissena polymorpha]
MGESTRHKWVKEGRKCKHERATHIPDMKTNKQASASAMTWSLPFLSFWCAVVTASSKAVKHANPIE